MKTTLYLGTDPTQFECQGHLVHYPVIKIVPRPLEELQHTYGQLEEFTHLIFTSKNAVKVFFDHLTSTDVLRPKTLIAIGKVTAAHLSMKNFPPHHIAQDETQEGVVQLLKGLPLENSYTGNDSKVGFWLRWLCSKFFVFNSPSSRVASRFTSKSDASQAVGSLLGNIIAETESRALCSHNGRSLQTKNLRSRLAKIPTFEPLPVYIFLPRSSLSRPLLVQFFEESGIRYLACDLYDTVTQILSPKPDLDLVDEIVFTSPSTVRAFLEIFGTLPKHKKLIAIGPVTEAALTEHYSKAIS